MSTERFVQHATFVVERTYPEERIVYTYSLDSGDKRISVSIATVQFVPADGATKLVFTEKGVFFDGHDTPEIREHGTKLMLDELGKSL